MKKVKILIAAFFLTILGVNASTNNISTFEENPVRPNEVLRGEIANLIGNEFPFECEYENTIQVVFTLNSNNELIVISTDTNQKEVDHFIKNKLNYKKVSFEVNRNEKIYLVPIRVSKS
ncbi:MAG: hypothetical protein ABFR05_12675 [Bacteroidota bacterium]